MFGFCLYTTANPFQIKLLKFVAITNERYIPVDSLVENLDKVRYTSLVEALILSGFDFTNKVSTKGDAIKQMYSILSLFG